jgi:uncharacterized protein YceK
MLRKYLVVVLLMVGLVAGAGCSSKSTSTTSVPGQGAAVSSTTQCPTSNTKSFAKTRFVADLGISFGVFHRYIWKPYKAGSFNKGAPKRIRTIIKGGVAGLFALNRLNAARNLVSHSPLLCKTLKQPLDALAAKLSGLTGKAKTGSISSSDIEDTQNSITDLRGKASQQGVSITDNEVSVPGT